MLSTLHLGPFPLYLNPCARRSLCYFFALDELGMGLQCLNRGVSCANDFPKLLALVE